LNTVTRSGRTVWGPNTGRGKIFSPPKNPDLLWVQPSPNSVGIGVDAEHLPSSSAEVKNEWSLASSPFACRHGADGDNTLYHWINILSRK